MAHTNIADRIYPESESDLALHCLQTSVCWKTCDHVYLSYFNKTFIYRNDHKFLDTQALANSADPDQTAPRGAV